MQQWIVKKAVSTAPKHEILKGADLNDETQFVKTLPLEMQHVGSELRKESSVPSCTQIMSCTLSANDLDLPR